MKKTIASVTVLSAFLAASASAGELVCASKKDETLYYSSGQLLLSADVVSETNLRDVDLSLQPGSKHGSRDADVTGAGSGRWIRFALEGDAWCSYKLALPAGFDQGGRTFPAFVDAACENNTRSSVRMSCRLR